MWCKWEKIKIKLILAAIVTMITFYQVLDTISVCSAEENIHMVYQLKDGENLQTVATKFNTTTERLQQINNIDSAYVGARVKVE